MSDRRVVFAHHVETHPDVGVDDGGERIELTAESTTLPDGSLEVKLRATPEKGSSFPARGTNTGPAICGPFSTTVTSPGHPWPMNGPYKLVNGAYRHGLSMPLPPGITGSIASEVVVKVKRDR